jgi:hypothetical protein
VQIANRRSVVGNAPEDSHPQGPFAMLYVIERKRPIRTLRGWAISTLQDAGAIRQCEYHGWLVVRRSACARAGASDRLAGRTC